VAQTALRLLEALEDHDDVQHVWANLSVDEEALAANAE
jgi:transcriptional/translational regulatory protein YebC/TACO1